ncbi:O-antigen ligase [Parabacteroides sp. ZJ-118]|uniref:O-antigen ligase family protein n=1 Tax=Parabacteroides sp. ZJ-118 TaxID=2709398 RepID=UPI0013EDFB3B|nr:O-antigen ligase family protein [Parabacteroides sp. ZJ-118]
MSGIKQSEEITFRLSNLILILGLGGIVTSLLFANIPAFGIISLFPLICIGCMFLLKYPWLILFVIFAMNYFIMGITRYFPIEEISVIMDISYVVALVIIFIHASLYQNLELKRAIHILSIVSVLWMLYCFLELINPTASIEGWIRSRGLILNGLIMTILASLLCTKYKILKALIFTLSLFTMLAVAKALMQKYIGFDAYEQKWLDDGGHVTHIIWSGTRYFSFFTDASNMGANLAAASMFFGISSFYMRSPIYKIYYLIVAILSLLVMLTSGSRGAMIIPLGGLALYAIISKQTTTIIGSACTLLFVYVFFAFTTIGEGNSTIRRMRTAFHPTEDASFNVRIENQKKLAPYLRYKPLGEGLGLSGDGLGVKVSERFTTSIPNDSWYVKIWVETGVIGLILYLGMILISIAKGGWIIATQIKDPELKGQLSGLLCGIFGMFLNAYSNSFWGQFPTMMISFMGLTFVLNGLYFDQDIQNDKRTISNN